MLALWGPKMEDAHPNSSAYSSLTNSNGDVRSTNGENAESYTNSAEEIRRIADDYNQTLKKATAQIKSLTRERGQLEAEYEKQLSTNEELGTVSINYLIVTFNIDNHGFRNSSYNFKVF